MSFGWNEIQSRWIWDIKKGMVETQLIAHSKEVCGIGWAKARVFSSNILIRDTSSASPTVQGHELNLTVGPRTKCTEEEKGLKSDNWWSLPAHCHRVRKDCRTHIGDIYTGFHVDLVVPLVIRLGELVERAWLRWHSWTSCKFNSAEGIWTWGTNEAWATLVPDEKVKATAKAGLATIAIKAKLWADHKVQDRNRCVRIYYQEEIKNQSG